MVLLLWALVGVSVGLYGTVIGAGGGFVLVPILLFVYPHTPVGQITAVSLAVVFANAVSGSVGYFRQRRADYSSGIILAAATIPGAILGALLTNAIPIKLFDLIMGIALVLVAGLVLLKPGGSVALLRGAPLSVTRHVVDAHGAAYDYRFNLGAAAILSLGIGFLSSLLGIGGGIIHVPMLAILFSFPAHIATATSQFVLMITAATGTVTHFVHRDFGGFVPVTLALAVGVIVGGQAGAAISERLNAAWLLRLLAIALLAVGIRLVLQGG